MARIRLVLVGIAFALAGCGSGFPSSTSADSRANRRPGLWGGWGTTAGATLAALLLISCSQPLPDAAGNLLAVGSTAAFEAVDDDGPWAVVTVTRVEEYDDPLPGADPSSYFVEFEVSFEITRRRGAEKSWAAQPDWTVFGQRDGSVVALYGLGSGELTHDLGRPMHNGPALDRPVDTEVGDTVHGYIRALISPSDGMTWLAWYPRSNPIGDGEAVWPVTPSWVIADASE